MEPKQRKWLEYGAMAAIVVAAVLAVAGAVGVLWPEGPYVAWGMLAWVAATFALLLALLMASNLETTSYIGRTSRGSQRYERLRRWTRVKSSSVLHSLLLLFASLVLIVGVLGRVEIVQTTLESRAAQRSVTILNLAFILNALYALYQSLRVRLEPDRTAGTRALFWVGLNVAGLIAAFAGYVVVTAAELEVIITLTHDDGATLILAALTVAGLMLSVSRGLPSLFALVSDPHARGRGGYMSQQKAVVMPTVVAFTLLFVFILLIIIFGAGIFSVLEEAGQNTAVLFILAVMAVAVLAGIAGSLFLSRQEDRIELYRRATPKEQRQKAAILASSISVGMVLLVAAFLANTQGGVGPLAHESWLDLAAVGLLVLVGPYGFYTARKHKHIEQMEMRFPDFLRDLASSHKGGLTLVQSVQVAARGEYGALTPEVQKLADQLSWNVPFEEAFQRFSERVHTPLVERSVNLVLEASRSGGNTTDVLLAAARDAREIKTLERERKITMSVYTTVIYVTFFVFLFVIGVLVAQFIPEIIKAGEATAGSDLAGAGGLNLQGVSEDDYRQFYFIAGVMQALGNGILAGVMGRGRAALGLQHAFIMVAITYVAFGFVL